MSHPIVRTKNIGCMFSGPDGDIRVLDGIDLDVLTGSMITIVGPSGCGKSTLLRIIAGLLQPTDGCVEISIKLKAGEIAYVPQGATLLPWRTALQNACLGLEIHTEAESKSGLSEAQLKHVHGLFTDLSLDGFEDYYPDKLSGGMAQRVALIRSLASRPKLLLCDEPFSAIDFVTRLRLCTLFKKLCKVQGITTIFVTHNIEEAMFLGDRVVIMSGRPGRITSIHDPVFSVGSNDAVECRRAPEFAGLFDTIWKSLEEHHAQG